MSHGETTFTETGTLRLDDVSGEWEIVSVNDGTLGSSPPTSCSGRRPTSSKTQVAIVFLP